MLRNKKGWTQEVLAKKAGMHRVSIAQIESGRRMDPALSTRKKLAQALRVKLMSLVE